jgi:hypothetical protein
MDGKELEMGKRISKETKMVEQVLKEHFPNHPADHPPAAYVHGSFIHVRVVDESFAKVPWFERLDLIHPMLDTLPDKTQRKILFVALLTPNELENSPLNYEFEHPTPLPRFPPEWRDGHNTDRKIKRRRVKRGLRS